MGGQKILDRMLKTHQAFLNSICPEFLREWNFELLVIFQNNFVTFSEVLLATFYYGIVPYSVDEEYIQGGSNMTGIDCV
jgi:hypothetical protein